MGARGQSSKLRETIEVGGADSPVCKTGPHLERCREHNGSPSTGPWPQASRTDLPDTTTTLIKLLKAQTGCACVPLFAMLLVPAPAGIDACIHYLQSFRCLRLQASVPAPIICNAYGACACRHRCLRPLFAARAVPALASIGLSLIHISEPTRPY